MATVRKAGWEIDDETGNEIFRVVVEYKRDDKLPDFPISVVWKKTPVEVVLIPPCE